MRAGRVLVGVLLLAATIANAPSAAAHAEIREADPPVDGVGSTGTEEISITLITVDADEPVIVSVLDADGNEVTTGEPEIVETGPSGTIVSVPVRPLEEGEHLVSWRATSTDGDGITADTYAFSVEDQSSSGFGIWLLWIVALGIPAAIFLRPGARRRRDRPA